MADNIKSSVGGSIKGNQMKPAILVPEDIFKDIYRLRPALFVKDINYPRGVWLVEIDLKEKQVIDLKTRHRWDFYALEPTGGRIKLKDVDGAWCVFWTTENTTRSLLYNDQKIPSDQI